MSLHQRKITRQYRGSVKVEHYLQIYRQPAIYKLTHLIFHYTHTKAAPLLKLLEPLNTLKYKIYHQADTLFYMPLVNQADYLCNQLSRKHNTVIQEIKID